MKVMNIGVVGYSGKPFDEKIGEALVELAFKIVIPEDADPSEVRIISGLTNIGIPALAYKIAEKRGYETVGIACKKAKEYDCFDCDEVKIVGEEWGDESETFLKSIDFLIRVGGGKQSIEETKKAKEMGVEVYEYDLPLKK